MINNIPEKHPLQTSVSLLINKNPAKAVPAVKNFLEEKKLLLVKKSENSNLAEGSPDQYENYHYYTFIQAQERMVCLLESTPDHDSIRIVHLDHKAPTEFNFNRVKNGKIQVGQPSYNESRCHHALSPADRSIFKTEYGSRLHP